MFIILDSPTLRRLVRFVTLVAFVALVGCIPSRPDEFLGNDGREQATTGASKNPKDSNPKKGKRASKTQDPALDGPWEDNFDRLSLGNDWRALSTVWKIENGRLCGQGARNKGVWLKRRLPTNARIEFDATSASADGDLKAELWGDGRSGATSVSYTDATS